MKLTILLAAVVLCGVAQSRKICKSSKDCGEGECCINNSRWLIASKRDIISKNRLIGGLDMTSGQCIPYVKESASCHYLGFTSCGCEPGTQCVYHPLEKKVLAEKEKRSMLFRPGDSFCEKLVN
ncbi:uncharacterized protein [Watersipora subatra]|uniref:uncharacterized protein n=1 Tax=Watersipora subatra TaxID=2589382 RepID=UPI00355C6D47